MFRNIFRPAISILRQGCISDNGPGQVSPSGIINHTYTLEQEKISRPQLDFGRSLLLCNGWLSSKVMVREYADPKNPGVIGISFRITIEGTFSSRITINRKKN